MCLSPYAESATAFVEEQIVIYAHVQKDSA